MNQISNKKFSHIDESGQASMVDISSKGIQKRTAEASGVIILQKETISQIKDNQIKKGDVLSTARIAGIQAAKQTANLIPLCHQLLTEKISVDFEYTDNGIRVNTLVRCTGKTGVEIEAITAASIALVTIYDMCKAIDKEMVISEIMLLNKVKEDI
ncbi:MAG: cyclic pyranopterin monophosphate synthase MoaC [Lentisphaeraceae bacterium]|nr:cyclic pyranopterin monophosphate synthase MoaC [Lentisphaeraceae bacterium]